MNWYLKVLKQYADFEGRARRTEYWMFALFNFIIAIVLGGLGKASFVFSVIAGLYSLAVIIPGIAVSVRRLHDTGKSGWMLLIAFIPIIGAIWLLVLFVTEGVAGENEYGTNPKEVV